jgi:hypothetical protein
MRASECCALAAHGFPDPQVHIEEVANEIKRSGSDSAVGWRDGREVWSNA